MTLQKIGLLDKVRVEMLSNKEETNVEANNLKINIFPESVRELNRLQNILS